LWRRKKKKKTEISPVKKIDEDPEIIELEKELKKLNIVDININLTGTPFFEELVSNNTEYISLLKSKIPNPTPNTAEIKEIEETKTITGIIDKTKVKRLQKLEKKFKVFFKKKFKTTSSLQIIQLLYFQIYKIFN